MREGTRAGEGQGRIGTTEKRLRAFVPSEPPAEPAPGVHQRMNLAWVGFVDGLDGNECDLAPGGQEGDEHFRFDLESVGGKAEPRQGVEVHKPESALGIRQRGADETRQPPGHPTVHLTPQPRHAFRMVHAVADQHGRTRFFGCGKESGYVFGRVLAITVQSHCPDKTLFAGLSPPGLERGAFAAIDRMADDIRAGGGGADGSGVRGTVVHDDHVGKEAANTGDDFLDAGSLIETRNDRGALARPIHAARLS